MEPWLTARNHGSASDTGGAAVFVSAGDAGSASMDGRLDRRADLASERKSCPCGISHSPYHRQRGPSDDICDGKADERCADASAEAGAERDRTGQGRAARVDLEDQFFRSAEIVRSIDISALPEMREIGRKRIPVPLGVLLVHISEHTQRHVGEAIVTTKTRTRGEFRIEILFRSFS